MAKKLEKRTGIEPDPMQDPNYMPPIKEAVPLGIQHVMAMLVGNIAVPFIIGNALGLDIEQKIFLVQAAMLMAGVATLFQTIGIGPVGARLPVVQGTSFAFLGPLIGIGKTMGMAGVLGAAVLNGIFQIILAMFVDSVRRYIPPLISGLVVLTIGATLLAVSIRYTGGHPVPRLLPDFGAWYYIALAAFVLAIAIALRTMFAGFIGASGVFIAIVAGYLIGWPMGLVKVDSIVNASWFAIPSPLQFGIEFSGAMILVMAIMAFVTTVETIGDISGITVGGAGREATKKEIKGGILADGLGTLVAALGNAMPNTSFSQNVGLIAYTGVMSRHVVTISGLVLIAAGLVPKFGALITAIPNPVFGGAAIMMFGLVTASGIKLISRAPLTRRNLMIIAVSLAVGWGIYAVPEFTAGMAPTLKLLVATPIIPVAVLGFVLNLLLPEEDGA